MGKKQEAFQIHKQVLVENCPYFAAWLRDCWGGDTSGPLTIEDITAEGFEVVVDYIYSGALPERLTKSPNWNLNKIAYKAADQLVMRDLQNKIVDLEVQHLKADRREWHAYRIKQLWQSELSHTPYYQMALRSCVRSLATCPMEKEKAIADFGTLEEFPSALVDILTTRNEYDTKKFSDVWKDDVCKYHIHRDERCYATVECSEHSPQYKVESNSEQLEA